MRRTCSLICLAAALSSLSWAATPNVADNPVFVQRPATVRFGFENVTLPDNEKMGLAGVSYLLQTDTGLLIGPAAYSAASGRRGGFFAGGAEVAYRAPVGKQLALEAGLFAGGGCGNGAPVGGGLMLRPHADLLWDFGGMRAGISYSSVRFPSGKIQSNQLGLIASFDDVFHHTSADQAGKTGNYPQRGGIGFHRVSIVGSFYQPPSGVTRLDGVARQGKMGLLGLRADQFINEYTLWGIEASGVAAGGSDGYTEVLGSFGVQAPLIPGHFYLGARGSLGTAGGGQVSTGGGLLAKAGLFTTITLKNDHYLTIEGGSVSAPGGKFRSPYLSTQLGFTLDNPYFGDSPAPRSTIEAWEWATSVQHYQYVMRPDGSALPMEVAGLKISRYLDPGLYFTGQAFNATHGNAGGYKTGLFGLGGQTRKTRTGFSAAAELLVGAAGGGGIATQSGLVVQPMAYLMLDLNKNWKLKAGAGKIESIKGSLDSKVFDVTLAYSFGLPSR